MSQRLGKNRALGKMTRLRPIDERREQMLSMGIDEGEMDGFRRRGGYGENACAGSIRATFRW